MLKKDKENYTKEKRGWRKKRLPSHRKKKCALHTVIFPAL